MSGSSAPQPSWRSNFAAGRAAVGGYVELIRNTPFLVQLFFIFFGLPSLGVRLDPVVAAALAMTLNLAAYGIEIVRRGPRRRAGGQWEAAMALGLRPRLVFVKTVSAPGPPGGIPVALEVSRHRPAGIGGGFQIAVRELTYEGDMLQARTFRALRDLSRLTLASISCSRTCCKGRLMVAGVRELFAGAV